MKRKYFIILLLMWVIPFFSSAQSKGKLLLVNIEAPSLSNSMIGEPTQQPLAIYLPPSYEANTSKKYPVVYFLPGYEDTIAAYTKGYIGGYYFESSMNSNITQGRTKEMIMVIVNGYNLLEGCFFQNSSVTGNWEDFVVKDVVNYMDANYRTIRSAESRAITGLSMGGYGALHLSMRHPSVFSIGVGECPGLANETGLAKTTLFDNSTVIKRVIAIRNDLDKLSAGDAHQKYLDTITYYRKMGDWITLFSFAYGSAFAPDSLAKAPYFSYPYSLGENNSLVRNDEVYSQWETGFGKLKEKIALYKDSLLKLRGYAIDYGTNDYFKWIPEGSAYYHNLLNTNGIPHRLWINSGDHGNLHKQRTEQFELPYCDSLLRFDTLSFNTEANIEKLTFASQAEEALIDLEKNEVRVILKSGTKLNSIKPIVYISPGAKVSPSLSNSIDLSSGEITYTITSESGNTKTWKLLVEIATTVNNLPGETLKVFPNPAYDFIEIKLENISSLQLFSYDGKCVLMDASGEKTLKLDRNKLQNGLYFLKVFSGNQCSLAKIVLN